MFSPPGVGGVLLDNPLAAQQACPARQVCGLTRGLPFAIRSETDHQRTCLSAVFSTAKRLCQRQKLTKQCEKSVAILALHPLRVFPAMNASAARMWPWVCPAVTDCMASAAGGRIKLFSGFFLPDREFLGLRAPMLLDCKASASSVRPRPPVQRLRNPRNIRSQENSNRCYELANNCPRRSATLQQKRRQPREKPTRDDDSFPNNARSKDLRAWRAKRCEQHHERRLANPNASLRDGHDGGDFCQWPREQPHSQRKDEAAGDSQEGCKQNISALHRCPEQPPEHQPVRTARHRANGVAKLREPAPVFSRTPA